MKKSILYIFTFLYFTFSTGITLNAHFCRGELQTISFLELSKDCNKCGTKKMKGCCKDISQSFQIDDEHTISSQTFTFKSPNFQSFLVNNPNFNLLDAKLIFSNSKFIFNKTQHFFLNTPIYIRVCSFLI